MSGRPGAGGRRSLAAFLVMLVFAIAAAGWQGWDRYHAAEPTPGPVLPRSEPITSHGVTIAVDRVERASSLPSGSKGEPDVEAPAGADFVLVVLTTTLTDRSTRPGDVLCDLDLYGPDGTRWSDDSDFTFDVVRPDALSCAGTGSKRPLKFGRPVTFGISYLVPAAVDPLVLQLGLSSWDEVYRRRL